MPQKTLNGEDIEEDELWSEGSFIESCSNKNWELKKRTFHMKHNEEMNYNCKQCNVKISAHNKDWHAGRCDKCFYQMMEESEVSK